MTDEAIQLVGGPMPGIREWRGGDEFIVAEPAGAPLIAAKPIPPELLSAKVDIRRGVYRRRGETSYFDWTGWH